MELFNPSQNFQTMYSPLGIYNGGAPFSFQTALPAGMVPDLSDPLNSKALQSGTPFTSEINMQNGVIYAGVKLFPRDITDALATQYTGYRIGLDIKDKNIAKMFLGNKSNFLFWDGTKLQISGQLRVYGQDNRIDFFDQNQVEQGYIYANNLGVVFDSINELIIGSGGNMRMIAGANWRVDVGPVPNVGIMRAVTSPIAAQRYLAMLTPFRLVNLPLDPNNSDSFNGQMYYNDVTDNIRAFVGGGWVTVV